MNIVKEVGALLILLLPLMVGCGSEKEVVSSQEGNPLSNEERGTPVSIVKTSYQDLSHSIAVVGSLFPEDEVIVSAEISEKIIKVYTDKGHFVKRGDTLLKLDSTSILLEMANAKASVEEASANLEKAKMDLKRAERLFEKKAISKERYDTLKTQLLVAKAILKKTRASFDMSLERLGDTKVVSPISGFVEEKFVSKGEYVKPGAPLFTLIDIDPIKLGVTIPEKFTDQIKLGQIINVRVEAYPDEVFRGKISMISPNVDQNTRKLKLEAKIPNAQGSLKPGFFARGAIITGVSRGALVIPQEAIFTKNEISKLFVVKDNVAHERLIQTGLYQDGLVEILSGIKEGEMVVVRGHHILIDGAKVDIVDSNL